MLLLVLLLLLLLLQGVRGSLGIYNLVLSMCERHGDAETSKKLLTLMRMDRVSPSVVSCNQVIRACEKAVSELANKARTSRTRIRPWSTSIYLTFGSGL